MTTRVTTFCAIPVLGLLAACSGRPAATPERTGATPAAAATASPTPDSARTALPRSDGDPAAGQRITATVLETMDASNYTYVRVKNGSGDVWAASSQFK